ncbi:MAG: hypothetical protein ACL7BU_09250 [Candidatus Phlomobacter fragariae]
MGVYLPKDRTVKYRVWSASEKLNSAEIK